MPSMITCVAWVPKGAARERPVRYELSRDEYKKVKELEAKVSGEGKGKVPGGVKRSGGGKDEEELPPELRMDDYDNDEEYDDGAMDEEDDEEDEEEVDGDDEDEDENDEGVEDDNGEQLEGAKELLDVKAKRNGDTYEMLETGGIALAMDADSEDEDAEDDEIRPTDSLVVVAMTEDEENSHLEVQLMSDEGDLYVHHDLQLPDFPLCLEWLDCPPFLGDDGTQSAVGNYIAVGTFQPTIEIWNLDVMDPLEPSASLGGEIISEEEVAGDDAMERKGTGEFLPGSHTDAIMCMSWNKQYRNILASGSADKSVKIWDITTQAVQHTFTHHKDKVQSVEWHPSEGWLLATGSYDRTVCLLDCRNTSVVATYTMPADIEAIAWDKGYPVHLYCACEDGQVVCIDTRHKTETAFSFQAHDQTCTALSFSDKIPGFLCTASVDKTTKVWDTSVVHEAGKATKKQKQPLQVAYKSLNAGKLFTMQMYGSSPFTLAAGGDKGILAIWNSDETAAIKAHFQSRVVEDVNTVFDYASLSQGIAQTSTAAAGEAEDDSWMDEPVDGKGNSAAKGGTSVTGKAAKKGKGKGKGKK